MQRDTLDLGPTLALPSPALTSDKWFHIPFFFFFWLRPWQAEVPRPWD